MNNFSLLLLTSLLVGCVANPNKHYTEMVQRAGQFEQVVLASDALIVNDVEGKFDQVDMLENEKVLNWLSTELKSNLKQKGYTISDRGVRSIGYVSGRSAQFLVFDGGVEGREGGKWNSSAGVEPEWSPFKVEQTGFDEASLPQFALIHERLATLSGNPKDMKQAHFPEVGKWQLPTGTLLVFSQSVGRRVPTGKQIAQGMLSALLSLGTVTMHEPSQTLHRLYVLDGNSGQLLWSHMLVDMGKNRKEDDMRKALTKILKDFPAYHKIQVTSP